MIPRRASLLHLMILVALLAVGLAAMKIANKWLAEGLFLLAFVGLLVATLGALVRRRNRVPWIGFAVFGWGYILLIAGQSFVDAFLLPEPDGKNSDWRVDDLVGLMIDRVHPVFPYPTPTFPHTATVFDPGTGRWTKIINDEHIPFSPAELRMQAEHDAQVSLHEGRDNSVKQSRVIGLAIQGLAFAMAGAAIGNALSDRSTDSGASSGTETSTLSS